MCTQSKEEKPHECLGESSGKLHWPEAAGSCCVSVPSGAAVALSISTAESRSVHQHGRAEQRLIAAAVGGAGRVCGRGLPGETLGLTISHFL